MPVKKSSYERVRLIKSNQNHLGFNCEGSYGGIEPSHKKTKSNVRLKNDLSFI